MMLFGILFAGVVAGQNVSNATLRAYDLRCNGLREAVGVSQSPLRFAWSLAGREDARVTKAQIRLDGRVFDSSDLFAWCYDGPELGIGNPHEWQVRLTDSESRPVSEWSEPKRFILALPNLEAWGGARWIGESVIRQARFADGTLRMKFKVINGGFTAVVRANPDGSGGCRVRIQDGLANDWNTVELQCRGGVVECRLNGLLRETLHAENLAGTFALVAGRDDDVRVRRLDWLSPEGEIVLFDEFCGHRQAAFFHVNRDEDGLVLHDCGHYKQPEQPNDAPRFRRRFDLDRKRISWATLSIASKGFYELSMNGVRADPRRFLAPPNPALSSSPFSWFDTYDVTSLVRSGENVIGVWLAPGYSSE